MTEAVEVRVEKIVDYAAPPTENYEDDAGFDLAACFVDQPQGVVINRGQRATVSAGFKMGLPRGHVGLICSRSGLAAKHGIQVLNAPGIVDAGYRGEVQVILHNTGVHPYHVKHGDRIAQLVIVELPHVEWVETDVGEASMRGANGLGSTGIES